MMSPFGWMATPVGRCSWPGVLPRTPKRLLKWPSLEKICGTQNVVKDVEMNTNKKLLDAAVLSRLWKGPTAAYFQRDGKGSTVNIRHAAGCVGGEQLQHRWVLYLNTLVVAVCYQHLSQRRGSHSLQVSELPFVSSLRALKNMKYINALHRLLYIYLFNKGVMWWELVHKCLLD